MKKFIKSMLFLVAFSTYASTANKTDELSEEEIDELSEKEIKALNEEVASAENDIKKIESQHYSPDDRYKEFVKIIQKNAELYEKGALHGFSVRGYKRDFFLPLLLWIILDDKNFNYYPNREFLLLCGDRYQGIKTRKPKVIIDMLKSALKYHMGFNDDEIRKYIPTEKLIRYLENQLEKKQDNRYRFVNIYIKLCDNIVNFENNREFITHLPLSEHRVMHKIPTSTTAEDQKRTPLAYNHDFIINKKSIRILATESTTEEYTTNVFLTILPISIAENEADKLSKATIANKTNKSSISTTANKTNKSSISTTANKTDELSKEEVKAISEEVASAENDIKQIESQRASTDDRYKKFKETLKSDAKSYESAITYFSVKGKNEKKDFPLLLNVKLNEYDSNTDEFIEQREAIITMLEGTLKYFIGVGENVSDRYIATDELMRCLDCKLQKNKIRYVKIYMNLYPAVNHFPSGREYSYYAPLPERKKYRKGHLGDMMHKITTSATAMDRKLKLLEYNHDFIIRETQISIRINKLNTLKDAVKKDTMNIFLTFRR